MEIDGTHRPSSEAEIRAAETECLVMEGLRNRIEAKVVIESGRH